MIVRLKVVNKSEDGAKTLRFNSMIVRLKEVHRIWDKQRKGSFNSMIVRLKAAHAGRNADSVAEVSIL